MGCICCCAEDGYDVDYLRVPVTDEKAPKDHDFELLIQVRQGSSRTRPKLREDSNTVKIEHSGRS
jgi:hypothetical protein